MEDPEAIQRQPQVATSDLVRPWVGKLHHARTLCDDWGTIRDESGRLILTVTVPSSVNISGWEQYRREGTDPTQPVVDAILAAINGPNDQTQQLGGGK
jgi:hypothetical protein